MSHPDKHLITRRDLLRGAAAGVGALAMSGNVNTAERSSKTPNIVFIVADDLDMPMFPVMGARTSAHQILTV